MIIMMINILSWLSWLSSHWQQFPPPLMWDYLNNHYYHIIWSITSHERLSSSSWSPRQLGWSQQFLKWNSVNETQFLPVCSNLWKHRTFSNGFLYSRHKMAQWLLAPWFLFSERILMKNPNNNWEMSFQRGRNQKALAPE